MNLHLPPTLHSWEVGLVITADQFLCEGTQRKWEHCSTVLNKRKLNSFCSVERSVDFWSGGKQFGWIKHERQSQPPAKVVLLCKGCCVLPGVPAKPSSADGQMLLHGICILMLDVWVPCLVCLPSFPLSGPTHKGERVCCDTALHTGAPVVLPKLWLKPAW